jgi:hypothetical protein
VRTAPTPGVVLVYRFPAVPHPPGPLLAAAVAVALTACAAPLGDAHPCPESACAAGRACVAGRCRRDDALPAAADTLRVVLAPTDVAVVAAHGGGGGGADLPDAVALGRAGSGSVVLLFRFAATWRDDAEVASAFLVLDPLDGAPPAASPIAFEMARILSPWRAEEVSWGRQPRLSVPLTAGSMRARPTLPVRVDVTPIVRSFGKRSPDDHGLALLATGADAYGAVISMGVSQGRGPRLEVYIK